MTQLGRPCKYCVANWAGMTTKSDVSRTPIVPDAADCEMTHRDDARVYALARGMAKVFQNSVPSDEQIAWFLEDADEVVDDFTPAPEKWRVRRLPSMTNDSNDGIEVRLRINDVTYVGLDGGKDSRGSVLPLATFRRQIREANAEAEKRFAARRGESS